MKKIISVLFIKKRPLDCVTWPFIVGWDKEKKDVFLWISDESFCPAVSDIDKIKKSGIKKHVISFLENKNFFKEIRSGERFIWPYRPYQIKLEKILRNKYK